MTGISELTGLSAGVGLGLAYFGSLWLVVRRLHDGRGWKALLAASSLARAVLLGAALLLLARGGTTLVALALVGIWLARVYLTRLLGERIGCPPRLH